MNLLVTNTVGIGFLMSFVMFGTSQSIAAMDLSAINERALGQAHALSGPFGKPEREAYGPDIQTDQGLWQIPGSANHHKENYKIPKELQDSKEEFFNRFTDPTTEITPADQQWLKDISYNLWRRHTRDSLGSKENPLKDRQAQYWYPVYPHAGKELLDIFDQIDPRKEYLDWVITFSEILASTKYYLEDKVIDDATNRTMPCWYRTTIFNKDFTKNTTREAMCKQYLKLLKTDPTKAEELLDYDEDHTFNSTMTMISGYYSHLMLRTAQSIYRHPELFDQIVPDYGLPSKRDSGTTYKEKADFFFKYGLEAIDYFARNNDVWNEEKGCYMNAFQGAKDQMVAERLNKPYTAREGGYKAWNRSFALMRAQAAAIVLMEAIDPTGYADLIAHYRDQINSNFEVWFDNQRQLPTSRGIARSWSYSFADYSKNPDSQGEDIGHGTATLHLAVDIDDLIKPEALTPQKMAAIGVNIVEVIYLPDEPFNRIGEHIFRKPQIPSSNGCSAYRALCASPYQTDVFPALSDAARAHPRKSLGYGYWKFLYSAKQAYRENLRLEQKRVAQLTPINHPPQFERSSATLKVAHTANPGQLLAKIQAHDPDPGQQVSYWLTRGNTTNIIELDSTTGELTISKDISKFNHELANGLSLTIVAVDDGDPNMRTEAVIDIQVEQPKADTQSDLLLHYSFDTEKINAQTKQITDLSSHGYHGMIHKQNGQSPASGSGVNGSDGLHLGINGFIQIPSEILNIVNAEGALSVAFWAKDLQSANYDIFHANYESEKKGNWNTLGLEPKGNSFRYIGGSPWFAPVKDHLDILKSDLPKNEWTHFSLIKDRSTEVLIVYINGKINKRAIGCKWKITHSDDFAIGSSTKSHPNQLPNVFLDDFRIYKRALNQADIQELMRRPE